MQVALAKSLLTHQIWRQKSKSREAWKGRGLWKVCFAGVTPGETTSSYTLSLKSVALKNHAS